MKKKGFTLVELLVVIAILAILVIIALPNVLRMFRNAKENTFVTEVQEILKTAEQKYISTAFTENECTCFSSKSTDKKHNLDMGGRNNIEYYVEFNDKGQVINLIVKDDSYQFVSEGEVIKVADIGNSTSGKPKTSEPLEEGTEVPACDENKSKSMLKALSFDFDLVEMEFGSFEPTEEQLEELLNYKNFFLGSKIERENIETLATINTNKVPEGVLEKEDVSDDNSGNIMMWWTDTDEDGLYEVTIGGEGGVRANTNSAMLFGNMSNLTSIDLTYLDTSEVTNMSGMFASCNDLKTLDLSHFDTSKVTNMSAMFATVGLENLDLSYFDTSNVKNMKFMFMESLISNLNLSSFNTSKVTNMSCMFAGCTDLSSITYGDKFIINEDTDISGMFYGTDKLENDKFKFDSTYADRFNGD